MRNGIKWEKIVEGFQTRDHLQRGCDYLNLGLYAMAYIPIMIGILVMGLVVALSDEVFK